MPSKTEEYLALAQRTANGLTRYWESWTDYLTTASRLYKYPFADQLMIYAQRPDATACAEFDIWRNRMNRYVRRGSKGIALLDESSGFPRLHYVFDVSDTGVRRNSRDPEVWQYNDDLKQPVSEMLAAIYGISGERVSQQLADVAGKLVADYWDNNSGDILAIVDGSLLMDYDEAGVEMQFKSAAAISVTYTLLERCGYEPTGWFDKDDFQAIYNFSTPDTVYTLGAAVSDISREVLRTVERAVKTTIRRRNNERSQHEYEQQSELHADRGLSSPEPDPASAKDPAGQVRQDAPELSETAAPGAVPHDAPEREPVPDSDRTGADRSSNEGADDSRSAGEEPGTGQREEPDSVGAAHEQPAGAGRGSDSDGTDLQLSLLDAVIPIEAQQIEHIDRAESEKSPSAFVLSQAEIENELRKHGSGFQDGKQRIIELYQTQPNRKLRAKALAHEYGIGGHSHNFLDGSSGFVNHDGKGLEFDHYPDHQKWQTFPNAAAANEALNAEPMPEAAGNFHITDDNLGVGGPKQKFARNIEAIQTLRTLEQEHRGATAEEQQVLSQYVGWGGLADVFDPNKENWSAEYTQLKGLLTEEEYAAARASTLNAHYTSPVVIRAIYDAVEKMGFQSGNILEPSMGIGNFFGMLPSGMADSRLYGVELDSITGRIAQKLYPQADITVAGFETTDRRDFYDLAVGNVPFGQYKVNDKAYNKLGFSIHNYFFAKTIDQIRPGGVIAFVTSRFTMDSKDSSARKYMAERADLLGAIRLPNNAFKANASTEVVSDILFLQKRDRPADIEPAWVQLGQTEDSFNINQYFVDHPEMVLGNLELESTQYGHDLTVAPIEDANLADQLTEAVQHIEGQFTAVEIAAPDVADAEVQRKTLPADPTVKNFSYTVVDGEIYYRENSIMTQIELSDNAKGRVAGMVELRQIVNELIDQQLNDFPDEDIKASQAKLNYAYDAFTAKYGLINDKKNARLFDDDSSYYLLCSLENLDENKNLKSKADMFTKRTIRPERVVTSVDTPSEALAVSIGEHGKVDLPYMAELLGTPGNYERITTELSGVIFKDPAADADDPEAGWQTADEYLSGNVRDKLRMAQLAAESRSEFKGNVDALTKAQPKDLEASEIDVRLGATWLAPSIVQQFMMETFQPPYRIRYNNAITVRYSPYTSEWRISNKSATGFGDIMATETYGTRRANAYKILEDTLNLRDSRVYDTIEENGKEKRVLNQNETTLAQQKQQAIKDAFAGWVWKDPQRRALLVKKYNELFNSTRPREYDGSHIHFVGMNPEINLREHQRNAVAHVLYGYNTLLAHEVGAGKSFEMAASAMELKRLGLCQKSLFVVPNHLTEQWASEFLRLYPNAKLLVTSKKDFEPGNRKKFCARIATGDYDAVIIGHSQFEKIPLSAERQERLIQEQMDEIEEAIEEAKAQVGEHFTVKQLEKLRKSLKQKLEKLQGADRKDDVVTFEQLGVDRLFVDESQAFKNLYLYTKMRNVAGLSTSEAQKSSDMFGKCRYLDEITGGRGVIFATGTPLSNSMTEMYTLMRYLQYNTLQQKGLTHFDAWASTFGETTTAIELAPEGYT